MSFTKITAEEIAEQQLLSALRLWHQGDYVSAITLAGAAEEILGKRLRKIGKEPSFDNIRESVLRIARLYGNEGSTTERMVADLLNFTRNKLKHYSGDEALEFNLRDDSIEMLERAIINLMMLSGAVHEEMIQFWGEIDGA